MSTHYAYTLYAAAAAGYALVWWFEDDDDVIPVALASARRTAVRSLRASNLLLVTVQISLCISTEVCMCVMVRCGQSIISCLTCLRTFHARYDCVQLTRWLLGCYQQVAIIITHPILARHSLHGHDVWMVQGRAAATKWVGMCHTVSHLARPNNHTASTVPPATIRCWRVKKLLSWGTYHAADHNHDDDHSLIRSLMRMVVIVWWLQCCNDNGNGGLMV